jgi:hypothetical protein
LLVRATVSGGWADGSGPEDGPVALGAEAGEVSGGIDWEGSTGDGQHGGIVQGVAEDDVGMGDARAGEGSDLAFVGGDVAQGGCGYGGAAGAGAGDAGGEHVVGGDVEAADTFFDDPVAGGADGPDVDAGAAKIADEAEHFGKDVFFDLGGEELGGGVAEGGDGDALVDLDHFAADVEFGDVSGLVTHVAAFHPVDFFEREKAVLHGPPHEGGACVSGPEGAVAIKDGEAGLEGVDASEELGGGEGFGRGRGLRCRDGQKGPPAREGRVSRVAGRDGGGRDGLRRERAVAMVGATGEMVDSKGTTRVCPACRGGKSKPYSHRTTSRSSIPAIELTAINWNRLRVADALDASSVGSDFLSF